MDYIISDIHGDKKKFLKMLNLIKFNPAQDKLYILGDVIDRGKYGIDIIEFIVPYIRQGSMVLIKGNHELFCQYYLEGKLSEQMWSAFGGEDTLRIVKLMKEDEKKNLHAFIRGLPHFLEIDTKGWGRVCLTHSGIDLDRIKISDDGRIDVIASIEQAIAEDEYGYLISDDLHLMGKGEICKLDKYIICGHVPTFASCVNTPNEIYIGAYYMDVDCGCGFEEGALGCYCFDSGTCFYV